MEMLVGGRWCGAVGGATEEVRSPFDGHVVGSVPVGGVARGAVEVVAEPLSLGHCPRRLRDEV